MRILRVVAFLFLSSLAIAQNTATITAHLADPGSTAVSSRTFVRSELKNTGGQQCKIGGVALVSPYVKDFTPNATGDLSFSIYKTSAITCGTSTGNAQWAFTIWRDGKPQPSCFLQVSSDTNLNSASCLNATSTPVTAVPTSSLFALLDGSNAGWTGDQTFNSHNLSGINSLSASSATISGALSAQVSLKICDANKYSGATWDAQITAAMADANCGIISAANLTPGTSAATVAIPNNKQVWLPCGTFTGGASVNPVFQVNNFGGLFGRDRNCTVITTNSGTANILAVANGANWCSISDMTIQSAVARTAGAGIRVQGGHCIIQRLIINPIFDGIIFDTASVSNDNVVRDVEITDGTGGPGAGSGGTWHCGIKNGGISAGTISGNTFSHVLISMVTAFTDAGFCIQDGSDNIAITDNSFAVANQGGSDSVAIHMELVNAGLQPTGTRVADSSFEGGITKEAVTIDTGLDTSFVDNTIQSSLRGMSINGGGNIRLVGNMFHLNQNEGLKINASGGVTATANQFSDSSQAVTNTSSDILVAAGITNFSLTGNVHKNLSATGKTCKDGIEILAGGTDFFSVTGDINNGSCTTTAIGNSSTGIHQTQCNPNGPCSNGVPVGFTGDYSAGRTTSSGAVFFGASTNSIDFGLTTSGRFTVAGGAAQYNFPLISTGTAAPLTGTGACATITTQTGGSWAGRATCTGTTGASTLTITPGITAPNGWICNVQDQTTRANLFQQTATVAASCTLTVTSVTQNDVFVFSAIAF